MENKQLHTPSLLPFQNIVGAMENEGKLCLIIIFGVWWEKLLWL